jgi:hypothetical protein
MRPPAVDKKSWRLVIAITQLSQSAGLEESEGQLITINEKSQIICRHYLPQSEGGLEEVRLLYNC